MKKGQPPLFAELTLAEPKDSTTKTAGKFTGTDNPRDLRAIHSLSVRPRKREDLDRIAGCSNAPDLIAGLRRSGLSIPCQRTPGIDRDGHPIKFGVYYFTDDDRRKLTTWLREGKA